jgi:peptidoglycan/LPS O-acetylase OafA/YrhL
MQRDIHLPRVWIKPYYKSFNGLRGFAVLTVFIHHYAGFIGVPWIPPWTWEGVDLFFVLSGFLITGILYDSLEGQHFFRNFYVRRALRIFPLFYGVFVLLLLLTPILHLHYHKSLLFFVFYVGNLAVPLLNLDTNNPTVIWIVHHGHAVWVSNIGHLWSLCIEEQFYLIWPTVIWLVRDRKKLMQVCGFLILATILGRIYLWAHCSTLHLERYFIAWSTYTRCDTILIGAWMALWLRGNAFSILTLRCISVAVISGSSIALFAAIKLLPSNEPIFFSPAMSTIGFTLVALISAGLILWCLDEESLVARSFQLRSLSALGAISYGFYVLHALPESLWEIVRHRYPESNYAIPFLAFGLTLALATLSFRYLETPFLRLKKVFAPQQAASEGNPPRLHVSVPRTQEENTIERAIR